MDDTVFEIRHVRAADKTAWTALDKHISHAQFDCKVRDKQGYIISVGGRIVGILRYNLFWDTVPFCTLLYISAQHRGKGYGRALTAFWENEMSRLGYDRILVSTQSDETAQNFYRAAGYCDCGYLIAPDQAAELFLCKKVGIAKCSAE